MLIPSQNWSKARKYVNFGLVLSYVLFTFVLLDVAPVAYGGLVEDVGYTYQLSTIATALNFIGLAIGCILFIPFTYRYGRRPIYIISVILQLASAIFAAVVQNTDQLLGSSFLMGLGGAISETIVQITIVDLFFVHQYATTNGWFLFMQGTGAYLGPVAAGYVVVSQGWRWMWWWVAIFLGVTLVLVLCFFEESTFHPPTDPVTGGVQPSAQSSLQQDAKHPDERHEDLEEGPAPKALGASLLKTVSQPLRSRNGSSKSLQSRLKLYTFSDVPIKHHFVAPFVVLFTYPAVAYTAITFGSVLSWFAVIISIASTNLIYPPYNFSPNDVGLINLAPFVGQLLGAIIIAPQSDKWIVKLAKRNGGLYEPEMRLWLALPGGVLVPAGIFMFGIGIAHVSISSKHISYDVKLNSPLQSAHWAVLAVGIGMFAVGFNICLDISLAYLADCYPNVCYFSFSNLVSY